MERFFAAAQDAGGTCLEAQRGCVHRDIRACLINNADHAHRHALAADDKTVRAAAHAEHLADRVGQGSDLSAALRDALDAFLVQHQAVNQAVGQTVCAAVFDVDLIGGDDLVRVGGQRVRNGAQAAVFIVCAELCHRVLDAARRFGDFL